MTTHYYDETHEYMENRIHSLVPTLLFGQLQYPILHHSMLTYRFECFIITF